MDSIAFKIPRLKGINDAYPVDDIAAALDGYAKREIKYAPWDKGSALPHAAFAIAYNDNEIFLKYYVTEDTIKAVYSRLNDPVYEDSCVEFFIAFGNDENYYNLEFNCMGNARVQYGAGKTGRKFISTNLLRAIRYQTMFRNNVTGDIDWELTLCIPKQVFAYHPQLSFERTEARVNFYKCGDGLPQPHFLCWSNIEAPKPEFHLTKFFKQIIFSPRGI